MTSMENKTFQIEQLKKSIAEQRSWGNNNVADLLCDVLEEEESA